jgi:hypothetical protein
VTKTVAGVGAAAALTGLVVTLRLLAPSGVSVGVDGGAQASAVSPVWSTWDAGTSMQVGCYVGPSVLASYCTYVDAGGVYFEQPVMLMPADGGTWMMGAARQPSCWCASDAGPCELADGGVPPQGSNDPKLWGPGVGSGCLPRACNELSSKAGENTSAPQGCAL